jgi:hypothetical protein
VKMYILLSLITGLYAPSAALWRIFFIILDLPATRESNECSRVRAIKPNAEILRDNFF